MTATRERPARSTSAPIAHRRTRRRQQAAARRRRWIIGTSLFVIIAALVIAGGLLVRDVLTAKSSLEAAQGTVGEVKAVLTESPNQLPELTAQLVSQTGEAREAAEGPLWRMAEALPWVGKNLTVVREMAVAIDDVAADAIEPLVATGAADFGTALKPVDGRIDVGLISNVVDTLGRSTQVIDSAADRVASLDASGTIGQVADAHSQLDGMLSEAAEQLDGVAEPAKILPGMLGADGPRTYLLLFQNPAEVRSLGGNPASMLLLTVDGGAVNITTQASSGDFPGGKTPPVEVDPNLTSVYYDRFPSFVMDIATRPDFPTMAGLAKGYWEREFGGTVDTVVSFDPVALASLLGATGPVTLPTGDQLTAENAVSLLLYEAYVRYKDPRDQDAFFASAARSVFDALVAGNADPRALIDSLTAAAGQGRLMLWSPAEDQEKVFQTLGVDGVLPADNVDTTTVGVYFNDHTSSKIDYFVDTAVSTTAECMPDGSRIYNVTYTVSSRLQPDQVKGLPDYISSNAFLPKGVFRTDAYVVGPVGSSFLDWRVDVAGRKDSKISAGIDMGRPVVRLSSILGPAGVATYTARFSAPAGEYGPLSVRTTPMVNATQVATTDAVCG